jgi:hypothetical protein
MCTSKVAKGHGGNGYWQNVSVDQGGELGLQGGSFNLSVPPVINDLADLSRAYVARKE